MSRGLCPSGRNSKRLLVSLICTTTDNDSINTRQVNRMARLVSGRFGFNTEFEAAYQTETGLNYVTGNTGDEGPPRSQDVVPSPAPHGRRWVSRQNRVAARYFRRPRSRHWVLKPTSRGPERSEEERDKLGWAFIHREGEEPYSDQLPDTKSISVFLRNAKDRCVPCSYSCPGCGKGSVRATISGISPYGIDSEVVGESVVDCLRSVLGGVTEIDYAKRGIIWNGHIPRNVRHLSGSWFNMALLDYLHRHSGILSDFNYPPEPAKTGGPEPKQEEERKDKDTSWFLPWAKTR